MRSQLEREQIKERMHFNPRTPLQSAMLTPLVNILILESISIHALHYRVRWWRFGQVQLRSLYFNPRTPLQSAIDGWARA